MIHAFLWAPPAILFLTAGIFYSWRQKSEMPLKGKLFSLFGFLVLFYGLGLQCRSHISLANDFGTLLLPLAFCFLLLVSLINIHLKAPLLMMLGNGFSIFLLLSGLRLSQPSNHMLQGSLLKMHIFLTLLSFSLILLTVVVAVLLYLQDARLKRQIKTDTFLPSLELLEKIVGTLDLWSLVLLTGAIGAGALHAKNMGLSDLSHTLPIFKWTLLTWFSLAGIIFARKSHRLHGTRFALSHALVLLFSLMALLGSQHG